MSCLSGRSEWTLLFWCISFSHRLQVFCTPTCTWYFMSEHMQPIKSQTSPQLFVGHFVCMYVTYILWPSCCDINCMLVWTFVEAVSHCIFAIFFEWHRVNFGISRWMWKQIAFLSTRDIPTSRIFIIFSTTIETEDEALYPSRPHDLLLCG
jgi:hypothetical protein